MGKVLVLFFGSGFTSLIYQVLWMRELGLLFGNTSHAAAVTLTAFFIGLAVGGYAWGKRAEKLNNPLRTYGYLELGVSLAALGYFFLFPAYQHIYPFVFFQFLGPGKYFSSH